MPHRLALWSLCVALIFVSQQHLAPAADGPAASHPPLRPLPELTKRPLEAGRHVFVNASKGNNDAEGSEAAPWRTLNHAFLKVAPGDTICLRGGVYREQVYCAVSGQPDAPITVRSYPGERVILDGGLAEFAEDPAHAWEPYPQGAPGEYRSVKTYKNIRDVVGLFADSHIGLTTYWHAMDLRAENELWAADPDKKLMVKPIWCGPGMWYDRDTGHIHARLAPTRLPNPSVANYAGESDPRKLSLVISPFRSIPLRVDMARHVRFQDLVVRGGGHDCVLLQMGIDITFDNVTIFAGTYGLRSRSTGPFRMVDSAIHGMIPPWAWRDENGLYTYTPRSYDPFLPPEKPANERNIARLNTHALLVTEGWNEFEVFAYPFNHDWDISGCEFTDGHDGVYLSGRTIRFHHNVVERIQDDAIYLSSPAPYTTDDIQIHQNLIRDALIGFSCNSTSGPTGNIFIARNIIDQRQSTPFNRPSPEKPEGNRLRGHGFLAHGGNLLGIETISFYHNTFLTENLSASYAARTWVATHPKANRRIFNNLFVYLNSYPEPAYPEENDLSMDGNLHWCPAAGAKPVEGFLDKVRSAKGSKRMEAKGAGVWEANALVADPGFLAFDAVPAALNDYRLKADSPAIARGVVLPPDLPDPLRPATGAKPDIGALPKDVDAPGYGRHGRIKLPLKGHGNP